MTDRGSSGMSAPEEAAKRALAVDPDNHQARKELVDFLVNRGRLDEASFQARNLLDRNPEAEEARLLLARVELYSGRPESVSDILAPLADDPGAQAILAKSFDDLGKHVSAAAIRFRLSGKVAAGPAADSARTYFAEQLLALVPDDPHYGELRDALIEGRYADADPLVFEWIENSEDQATAALGLADWLLLQGHPDEAERLLSAEYPQAADHGPLNNRLGDAAMLRGELDRARQFYRKATVLDPDDWNAWLDLSRVEYLRGDAAAAREAAVRVEKEADSEDLQMVASRFISELTDDHVSPREDCQLHGLAWTEKGGSLTQIEVRLARGEGQIQVTGNVARTLEDAARTAVAFLRAEERIPRNLDVHINLPYLNTFKEGGSAGLLVALVVESSWKERTPQLSTAVTGEIGLRGAIRAIGGVREKLLAAYLHGMARVIYPAENASQVLEIPLSVRGKLDLVPVARYSDAYDCL